MEDYLPITDNPNLYGSIDLIETEYPKFAVDESFYPAPNLVVPKISKVNTKKEYRPIPLKDLDNSYILHRSDVNPPTNKIHSDYTLKDRKRISIVMPGRPLDENLIPQLYNPGSENNKLYPQPGLDAVMPFKESKVDVFNTQRFLESDPETFDGIKKSNNKPHSFLERFSDLDPSYLTLTSLKDKKYPTKYKRLNKNYNQEAKENYTDIGSAVSYPLSNLGTNVPVIENYTSIYGAMRYPIDDIEEGGMDGAYSYGKYSEIEAEALPDYNEQINELRLENPDQDFTDFNLEKDKAFDDCVNNANTIYSSSSNMSRQDFIKQKCHIKETKDFKSSAEDCVKRAIAAYNVNPPANMDKKAYVKARCTKEYFHDTFGGLFNTVLRDHPDVNSQSQKYGTYTQPKMNIPDSFDGRTVWKDFLVPVRNQGQCGSCWAYSSSETLSDRFAIWTLGQLLINLSAFDMVICNSLINPNPPLKPNVASQNNRRIHGEDEQACQGNMIYNALEYTYTYGLVEANCFNEDDFTKRGFKLPTDKSASYPKDLPTCEQVQGKNYDRCLPASPDSNNKTDQAARYFRTCAGYNVTSDDQTDDQKEIAIKTEILMNGPVAIGFIVYSDFMGYKSGDIYDHSDGTAKEEGGHAVEVVGWGNKNGVKYWIIRNSWGTEWGDQGYFLMKINCGVTLEDNVVSFIPDLKGINASIYPPIQDSKLAAIRNQFNVDPITFYRVAALLLLKQGQLTGDQKPILDTSKLPNFSTFMAMSANKVTGSKNEKIVLITIGILLLILSIVILRKKFLSRR